MGTHRQVNGLVLCEIREALVIPSSRLSAELGQEVRRAQTETGHINVQIPTSNRSPWRRNNYPASIFGP